MSRLLALFAALFAFLTPLTANAYWEFGHETVAKIAYLNVRPDTRAAIDALLRRSKLLDTPACPARTIEQASVWPDCIKQLGERFSYAYSWHYQNVNICEPFDLKSACKDGNCVSAQIERDMKLLKDKSVPARERLQALAFLVHFVGDLHQPLHAADRADLGGNRQKAQYGDYATDRLNLHSIWDGPLAERAITTPPSIVRTYSQAEKDKIAAGSVEDWSRQNWEVSRDVAYKTAMGGDPCGPRPDVAKLDNDTITKELVPVAKLQVERAGLRLAKLLDEALG